METRLTSYQLLFIGIILLILGSCGMPQVPESEWIPEFRSISAEVGDGNVLLNASLSSGDGVLVCGFYYGLSEDEMIKVTADMDGGGFSYVVSDLEHGKEYNYRAFAGNGHNFIYSDVSRFKFPELPENPDPGPEDPGPDDPGNEDPDIEYSLSLPFDHRFLPVEASVLEVEVGGNADFEFSEPRVTELGEIMFTGEVVDWVRCERNGRVCTFYVEENQTSETRLCGMEFRSLDHTCICILYLQQVNGGIEASTYEIVAGPEEEKYYFDVYVDAGLRAGHLVDWIYHREIENNGVTTIELQLYRNPLTTDRTAQIGLHLDDLGLDSFVEVIQKGRDEEIPEQVIVDVEIPYDQTEFKVTPDNLHPGSSIPKIPSDKDWIWYYYWYEDSNTFLFLLQKNTTGQSRSVQITFTDRFKFSYIVNLTQLPAPQE